MLKFDKTNFWNLWPLYMTSWDDIRPKTMLGLFGWIFIAPALLVVSIIMFPFDFLGSLYWNEEDRPSKQPID